MEKSGKEIYWVKIGGRGAIDSTLREIGLALKTAIEKGWGKIRERSWRQIETKYWKKKREWSEGGR